MKLIYTWIEKYRNLEKIGLNWDNEFEVEFTEDTQTINIKKNDDYFNLFSDYSCIENIKVIVGKNGTGKTNIMHLLGNGINNCDLLNPSVSDLFLNIYHYKNNEYIIEGNGMINLIINHSIDNHKTYCILAEYEDKEKRFKYKEPFNGYRNEISFVIYFNRLNSISNIPNKRDNIKRFAFRRTENNLIQKCDFIYNINSSDVQQKNI
ncbi:hypothetical protein PO903_15070 [Paenibacillus sp. PK4536]|uniref:hypothetical protein n=1 Tax=Paenibacillus sp. PK4536 TaxID=3024576 RepID=UPI002359BFB6|nr:hypothetical protein [Paenibacillus sp. PK4536]WIM37965.1 hypothetical protein PO903_15070 [Paenibacillus sp. PK4536]